MAITTLQSEELGVTGIAQPGGIVNRGNPLHKGPDVLCIDALDEEIVCLNALLAISNAFRRGALSCSKGLPPARWPRGTGLPRKRKLPASRSPSSRPEGARFGKVRQEIPTAR